MSAETIVAVIQARMGSVRLPAKVLAPLGKSTLLEQLLDRVSGSRLVTRFVVATTQRPEDDAIAAVVERRGGLCVRGADADVLDRFETAAAETNPDVIVRLTADNPLVTGAFVDDCVGEFLDAHPPLDYLDTMTSGTYPYGFSVEVVRRSALRQAWAEAVDAGDREHVTTFLRRYPDRFRCRARVNDRDDSDLRWTVDTSEDLNRLTTLYTSLGPLVHTLDWKSIVDHCRRQATAVVDSKREANVE